MQTIKKRGKSTQNYLTENAVPKVLDAVYSPDQLPSNLILHLKKIPNIKYNENDFDSNTILDYNPSLTTPLAYDPEGEVSKFSYVEENTKNEIKQNEFQNQDKKSDTQRFNLEKLCWWCCHTFNTKKIGIPIKKTCNNEFECVGHFCSPQCTCAYIMDSGSRYGDRWVEYELLHEMLDVNTKIIPAPRRELLKVFGGDLDINSFRGKNNWNIIYPPMVSLKLQMDDTPCDKIDEDSSLFLNSNNLKIGSINLDIIDAGIPEKKKKDKINVNGCLDRFWGFENE